MVLQPSAISSYEMVNGGEIRTAFGSNNNQKRMSCRFAASNTSALVISGVSMIRASIRPLPRTSLIK